MANEATVRTSLQIRTGNLDYQGRPTSFQADVPTAKGPYPGNQVAKTTGTDVDFSGLTTPGFCRFMNLDGTNYVRVGVSNGTIFLPFMKIPPGHSYVLFLDDLLGEEIVGSGTQSDAHGSRVHLIAHLAPCNVLVEAFEAN